MKKVKHICKVCKKKFEDQNTKSFYCSDKCYKKEMSKPLGITINGVNF